MVLECQSHPCGVSWRRDFNRDDSEQIEHDVDSLMLALGFLVLLLVLSCIAPDT